MKEGVNLNWLNRISNVIDKMCKHIVTYLLVIISVFLFVQVVARFIFNTGTFWTDELARFSMVWIVFLGAAIATRENTLINVDLVESLYPKTKKPLYIFQAFISLAFYVLLLIIGWETMGLVQAQRSPNMGISMSILYASIPISMIIAIFHQVVQLINRMTGGEHN